MATRIKSKNVSRKQVEKSSLDKKMDKKYGFKEGSKKDKIMDKKEQKTLNKKR